MSTSEFEFLEGSSAPKPHDNQRQTKDHQASAADPDVRPSMPDDMDQIVLDILGIRLIQNILGNPEVCLNRWYWAYYLVILGASVVGVLLLPIGAADVFDGLIGEYPLLYLQIILTLVIAFKALRALSHSEPSTSVFRKAKLHVYVLFFFTTLWFTIFLLFLIYHNSRHRYYHRYNDHAFGRVFLRVLTTIVCFLISAVSYIGAKLLLAKSRKIAGPPPPPTPPPTWETVDAVQSLPKSEGGIKLD